jgi:hypothetical protein
MLSRGGKLTPYFLKPAGDATWSEDDWATAATLEARWIAQNVSEEERRRYIPCAVLVNKFPGMLYPEAIMIRLNQLSVGS